MAAESPPTRKYKFGWYGDGGLGERCIQAILAGRKTASACPAYDPEDADLKIGDKLDLVDKHGKTRGMLVVTNVEVRTYGSFDDDLARRIGETLDVVKNDMTTANGRELAPDEEMRVISFELVQLQKKIQI